MAGALILMAYGSSNGSGVTLSPRLTSGHVEPTYEPSIQVDILPGSGISGDNLTVNGRCSNCRSWSGGSINVRSTGQNMIFAAGRDVGVIFSDSKTADIREHAVYGVFTMDLTQASGPGHLPVPNSANVNSIEASLIVDNDVTSALHGKSMDVVAKVLAVLTTR
jgi:Cytochrome domain of cellobiose dehydrogenase